MGVSSSIRKEDFYYEKYTKKRLDGTIQILPASFIEMCGNGHIEAAKWLLQLSQEIKSPIDIRANNDYAFRWSCRNGKIEMAKWLWQLSQEIKSPINIRTYDDFAFKMSCNCGHVEVAKWLCTLCPQYSIIINDNKEIKYEILENNNIIQHKIEEKNLNLECIICCELNNIIINLKCQNKHNHYYCTNCFCQWYTNHPKKCLICMTPFEKDKVIAHSYNK